MKRGECICNRCGKPNSCKAKKCGHCAMIGNKNALKSGRVLSDGRVLVKVEKGHPMANGERYCYESRLVLAAKIGRMLRKEEVAHHVNGVKDDNRSENLMLFPSNGKHLTFHAKLRREEKEKLAV